MNKEEAISSALQWVQDKVEGMEGFVEREAPALATEIVAWQFWSHAVYLVVLVSLAITLLAIAFWLYRKALSAGEYAKDPLMAVCIAFLVGGFMALFAGVGENSYYIVRSCVAPRLVVLDEIKSWVKE